MNVYAAYESPDDVRCIVHFGGEQHEDDVDDADTADR